MAPTSKMFYRTGSAPSSTTSFKASAASGNWGAAGGSPSYYFSFALAANVLNHFNVFNYWIAFGAMSLSVKIHRRIDRGLLELVGP